MIRIRSHAGVNTLDLEEFERRVARGEIAPDTPVNFPLVTGERWVPARQLEVFRGLYRPDRIYFMRYFNLSRFPWMTAALVLVNAAVFLAMHFSREGGAASVTGAMVEFGAKARPLILDLGETWRLLSANVVHRDWLHLAFNLFVLFNVGGALENAYRPLDYLLVLVASALGTTLLSFLGSAAVSAGASGMVFGCFGGIIVFGLKYRDIIPRRYRRFFGSAVVPYVLIFLWIGWMSDNTDNWGHLGGLIAGTVVTLLLRPRLLEVAGPRRRRRLPRVMLLALLTGGVIVVGPLLRPLLPILVRDRDPEFGIEIAYPWGWGRSITALGWLGVSNRMKGAGPTYLHVFTEERTAPVDLTRVADEWFDEELYRHEHAGRVRRVRRGPPVPARVAGREALRYDAAFELYDGRGVPRPYLLRLFVLARGSLVYTLVFLAPESRFASYTRVFDRMLEAVRLDEPAFLLHARAETLIEPESPAALRRLGEAWARLDARRLAEETFRQAIEYAPSDPFIRLSLARLLLRDPKRRDEAVPLLREVARSLPHDPEPLELLAEHRLATGRIEEARRLYGEALRRDPRRPALRQRVQELTDRAR